MDKKILSSCQLLVYEDGSIKIEPMELAQPPIEEYANCSSRIKQALLVVSFTQSYVKNGYNLENAFVKATTSVADKLGTSRSSVLDKVTRQLHLTAPGFREKLRRYFDHNDLEIKNILLNNIGAYSRSADEKAIMSFFE